jgi:hypothetical protein
VAQALVVRQLFLARRAAAQFPPTVRQNWAGRQHFFAAAAEAMRRILVGAARRKQREFTL